ncbi:imelysin family protein [Nisaea acidiphila]|uniref:Imelysin family protein n=1 Tax=Nisaea acidiphila TaxID=1862145 RepID=A0A9J7AN47_9PROT|nr:imelysin family protein [Nisaea acidiphila]UUX48599.1 imelysin family protein [Nisaea acidiphila]
MRQLVFRATAVLAMAMAGSGTASAQDSEATHGAIAQASVTRHILPRYERLAETGEALTAAADTYCAVKNAAAFSTLDRAFRDYWIAWAGIRHIQFGPVTYLDRAYRIQFWPDTRNKIGKQLSRTLSAADETALSADRFSGTSVAIQGLPALERLLAEGHESYATEKGTFRCSLTTVIARNLADMARNIAVEWNPTDGYAQYLSGAGSDPDTEIGQVSIDLLQSLLAEVEASRDLRIGRPIGSSVETARPKLAEAWRSGLSLEIMATSVEGIADLYLNGGFDTALRMAGNAKLADRIATLFSQVSGDIAAIGMPLYRAYEDAAARRKLETIRAELKELAGMIRTDLAVSLDISPGFNSRDGD